MAGLRLGRPPRANKHSGWHLTVIGGTPPHEGLESGFGFTHAGPVESEARRRALYTGFTDVLGPDLAESLMSYLPVSPESDLVTRAYLDERIGDVSGRIDALSDRVDRLSDRVDRLSDRMDRLQTTLLGGFAAMIAALLATGFLG